MATRFVYRTAVRGHARPAGRSQAATPISVLSIKDESANECHRILLAGDFDLATAPMVDERVDSLVRGGKHKLEIDLTDVVFIDSSGLASLVSTRRKLGAEDRSLVLTGAGSHLMKIFEITGLVRYFEFTQATPGSGQ